MKRRAIEAYRKPGVGNLAAFQRVVKSPPLPTRPRWCATNPKVSHPCAKRPGLLLALWLLTGLLPAQQPGDLTRLTRGVTGLGVVGVPGPLVVFGKEAFTVIAGQRGKIQEALVAAGRLGRGRVVALGHEGYLQGRAKGLEQLLPNALRWAAGKMVGADKPVRVGLLAGQGPQELLRRAGFKLRPLNQGSFKKMDVVLLSADKLGQGDLFQRLDRFVRAGGGCLLGGLGWGWLQLHPGRDLGQDFAGNRFLLPAGIQWADGTLRPQAGRLFAVSHKPAPLTHARRALEVLGRAGQPAPKLSRAATEQALGILIHAYRSLPPGKTELGRRLAALAAGRGNRWRLPSDHQPLGWDHPLDRLALSVQIVRSLTAPPQDVQAHPAARLFPGQVPEGAPRVTRRLVVDARIPGWHSSGLYAAPGEVVTVTVRHPFKATGWRLRIGAHKDLIWHKQRWRRAPEITRTWPLVAPLTKGACAFGGLIYVVVPKHARPAQVALTIRGAVEAPFFEVGRSSLAAWLSKGRRAPAPWGEIASRKMILTVPSRVLRKLKDPVAVMKVWDRILDLDAELAGRTSAARRPERMVTDVQISAGYMHSGYPVMCHLDQERNMVDVKNLLHGNWGFFHELGHNHQQRDWTFAGTGEVTVNLFSLYVMEHLCGKDIHKEGRMSRADRLQRMKDWDFAHPDHALWKRKPFLALVMYAELEEAFGWKTYKRLFRDYLALPKNLRPHSEQERRDQWLVRFSHAVGHNLGPFFTLWGVPTSPAARASLKKLPLWISPDIPKRFWPRQP